MQPQRDPTVWTSGTPGAQHEPRAIIALAFSAPQRAKDALDAAMMLQDRGMLAVHDAVFLFRPTDARARVHETRDPSPTVAAVPGSLLGALLGALVAGPLGLVVGGAVGAGSGALAARLIDIGISDEVVIQLREMTAPGDTVLALLVSDVHGAQVIEELRRFQGARIVYATLPDAALELVRRTLIPEHRAEA